MYTHTYVYIYIYICIDRVPNTDNEDLNFHPQVRKRSAPYLFAQLSGCAPSTQQRSLHCILAQCPTTAYLPEKDRHRSRDPQKRLQPAFQLETFMFEGHLVPNTRCTAGGTAGSTTGVCEKTLLRRRRRGKISFQSTKSGGLYLLLLLDCMVKARTKGVSVPRHRQQHTGCERARQRNRCRDPCSSQTLNVVLLM